MRIRMLIRALLMIVVTIFFWALTSPSWALPQEALASTSRTGSNEAGQITIPARPATPLFKSQQGKQPSQIRFSPANRMVTLKLRIEDPNGYFIPDIHPDNFAVYEDGVRQKIVSAEVEHAPVSVALLMQMGGRYHELNQILGTEVPMAAQALLDVLGRQDRVAAFTYASQVKMLAGFNEKRENLSGIFQQTGTPGFSEANLYDALLQTLNFMQGVSGRKAIILISSGVDTFSKATYDQVLQAAQEGGTPIYIIGLGEMMRGRTLIYGAAAPFAHINWDSVDQRLEKLATASGGRAYLPETDIEFPAIYDDIMENLRLRYVITYISSNPATSGPRRHIQVQLIDPQTGAPLKIVDSNGKPVTAKVFVQGSYSPGAAVGG
jgi:Ca-activated chloride channel family protein